MSRLSISGKRANTALNLLILTNVLVFANWEVLRPHLDLRHTYRISDGSMRSMVLSIFYHVEMRHLCVNMLPLHRYGTQLFVQSSSRRWHAVFLVLLSYVACGVGAFWGVELLSRYHQHQLEKSVLDGRYASKCNHWLCESLNDALGANVSALFTNALADLKTSFHFADVKFSMWHYRVIRRIGASGVVYGWMGMRVMTSWISPYHSRLNGLDYFFLISTLAHDLNESPLSLEDLRISSLLKADGVDHAAHVMGFVFGMLWAGVFILWEKVAPFGTGSWRWWGSGRSGRRLGAMFENDQVVQEQSRPRREDSILLHTRGSTGQQSSGRVML